MPTNRRGFLARLGAAGAALAALPDRVLAQASGGSPPSLPRASSGLPHVPAGELPSEFWRELRKEFLIPEEEAFFNTGTLGSSPRVVLDAVVRHMTHVDKDIAHWDYKEGNENYFTGYYPEDWLRGKVAALLGCDADESRIRSPPAADACPYDAYPFCASAICHSRYRARGRRTRRGSILPCQNRSVRASGPTFSHVSSGP